MSKSKHTPGPWLRRPGANDSSLIRAACSTTERPSGTKGVASVHAQDDEQEAEANIRLIAAAPAMFEALEDMECEIVEQIPGTRCFCEHPEPGEFGILECTPCLHRRLRDKANAALALARGEQGG